MPLEGFHPTIQRWFTAKFGQPTEPQRLGWPHIRSGRHTLIAAPTGTGKTIAGYLSAIDALAHDVAWAPRPCNSAGNTGQAPVPQTHVLYISPLRALSNDVQKNLQIPLRELAELDPAFPKIRVLVRTGDTPAHQRSAMLDKPPHILVTTPESFYILLTTRRGQEMLRTVRTVIVDEIHALARDKRGSHLALSLERLEALTKFQRVGLSATQKPLSEVAKFLVGARTAKAHGPAVGPTDQPDCAIVDVGHRRAMDVAIEVPPSPLQTVCSHEQWDEIYQRIAQLIDEHRTTLVFVNTRKLAERITARLTKVMGEEQVTCHHSSLSKARRLDAEHRLKTGTLKALVATASLELGIDIGDVDLVIQIGATRSIATFLQRVGRSGHAVRGMPKGRLFPLTMDELIEAAALLRAVKDGQLDRTPQPAAPLDILAQQIVAACVSVGEEGWREDALFELLTRAWPYRNLKREDFDAVLAMHSNGKRGLLHRDGVHKRVMPRKRARIAAVTGGGAIADVADYRVLAEPDGTFVGTLNEDFAVESNVGDIFQLGNTSWRVLKVERGVVRVADAHGQPPSIPFWLGESASRTQELSAAIARLREDVAAQFPPLPVLRERDGVRVQAVDDPTRVGTSSAEPSPSLSRSTGRGANAWHDGIALRQSAIQQIEDYIADGVRVLGAVPTQKRIILERFFDEAGGMQMVLHAPFGGRINRAWGLALRKKFCRGFGFELQAAANEEAIIISLGPQHSFPLADVFNYLHPNRVRETLTQAVLDQPMFESRWRWNATRSLVLEKFQGGKPVPPQIMRMRAADLLALTFPAAVACPENMPAGDLPIPMEHPLVWQTIEDCLTESTDLAGLTEILQQLRAGAIEKLAVDTPEPSAFARGILNSEAYTFLDDAPLEERRTQAVLTRRTLEQRDLDSIGALDPAAVQRVRDEAWPEPESVEEVHDALLWMGYVTDDEASPWLDWLHELQAQHRVIHRDNTWRAVDGPTDAKTILLGRLEALGPVFLDEKENPLLLELEHEGSILRTRLHNQNAWCERRLLARIHRYTLEKLRREIEPVSASEFLQFLAAWQHVGGADDANKLEGPAGVAQVLHQLAGFEAPAWAWESQILPKRVCDYKREWLDDLTLSGEFVWGRFWGGATSAIRVTPIAFIPRERLDDYLAMTQPPPTDGLCGPASDLLKPLLAYGAMFPQGLQKAAALVSAHMEMGLADLVARGFVTCDSFAALRQMITPPSRRRHAIRPVGRWSRLRTQPPEANGEHLTELVARQLLKRTGIVFRRTIEREKFPVTWSALSRFYRRLELRGEVRGGRFVAGFSGEQFALPEAVEHLRHLRRQGFGEAQSVASADPLNFQGILTPSDRVPPTTKQQVLVG